MHASISAPGNIKSVIACGPASWLSRLPSQFTYMVAFPAAPVAAPSAELTDKVSALEAQLELLQQQLAELRGEVTSG